MIRRLASFAFLVSVSSFAGIDQAPPNFPYGNGDAVFVDFKSASYHLVYDLAAQTVNVDSVIEFEAPVAGYPIFDLVPEPRNVRLDDRDADVAEIADPDHASHFRVVRTSVSPGMHRLTLSHSITTNVVFRSSGVASAFWTTDLTDRRYLEQYLPTNFLFDQYPSSLRVEVVNAVGKPHVLRANGIVTTVSENIFQAEFPAYFSASSLFFHLSPVGAFTSSTFILKSVDGRDLPVEVYAAGDPTPWVNHVKSVIPELEADYGPFPHAKVIAYGVVSGGMEYSGATMSSPTALGHELFHSYNARGVMPADGNSGWMDEAMSSWRDRNYPRRDVFTEKTDMAGHSPWFRKTDTDAYSIGTDFLEWMAGRMAAKGKDFKLFLREYFRAHLYQTVVTEDLRTAMEIYGGLDLAADFDRYIYGKSGVAQAGSCGGEKSESVLENPFHPRMTKQQLLDLL